jgi:uncharacterized protein (TIGR02996 family)
MSDRAALLAAICANPDEDTPRLVYADWLEENGQAKRAAVIRKQIEDHRLTIADTALNAAEQFLSYQYLDAVERVKWGQVDAELGARMVARKDNKPFDYSPKTEGLPSLRGVSFENHSRGFFDFAAVTNADQFLAHVDAIFAAAPITAVSFQDLTAEQARAFAASGHLARVRELYIDYGVGPDAIRALGTHRDAAGVRKLDITPDGDEASAMVEALTAGKYWTGLETLVLSDLCEGAEPPEEGQIARLFARPQFRNLRAIDAWGSASDDAALRAIVKSMPELRTLKLALNPIPNGDRILAGAKNLRHLRVLELDGCEMEGGDPTPILAGPNFPNLAVLQLGDNMMRVPNPKALAKSARGPELRVLDLGSTEFTPQSLEALVKCPVVRGLWYLSLCGTQLEDDHIERFTQHAAFDRLAYLDLSINEIKARGAKALANWPGAARLQSLDLWNDPIGAAGAKLLAASPNLTGLKYLHANKYEALKKRFGKVYST